MLSPKKLNLEKTQLLNLKKVEEKTLLISTEIQGNPTQKNKLRATTNPHSPCPQLTTTFLTDLEILPNQALNPDNSLFQSQIHPSRSKK